MGVAYAPLLSHNSLAMLKEKKLFLLKKRKRLSATF